MNKAKKPLISYIADFLEYCEIEKGLADSSIENYDRFLNKFKFWLKKTKRDKLKPHEFDDQDIWDFRLYLAHFKDPKTGKPLKKTTQNYYLIGLRVFLIYLAEKDILSYPANKIKLPKITDKDKSIKFLDVEQIKRLLACPDIKTKTGQRDRAILEVLFSTGLRVSELTSLNIDKFNLEIIKKLKGSYELNITGKGGRARTIYFSQRALYWLIKYLMARKDKDKALFVRHHSPIRNDKDSKRLTPRSVQLFVSKYTKMAGLPVAATPHTLRHSYATDLLNQGADLRSVQELLGHKNIITTQTYTHIVNKQLRDMHEKYHSLKEEN